MMLMSPKHFNPKQSSPRHVMTKLSKTEDKERILKPAKEKKNLPCKGTSIRLSVDFSADTLQARGEWDAKGC